MALPRNSTSGAIACYASHVTFWIASSTIFEATDKGDKLQADQAKQEFLAISKAEPLKSVIFGDQPNYKALLIDLLSDIERVGEKLPVLLTRKCQAIRKRLGIDDASFGLAPDEREQPKKRQQTTSPAVQLKQTPASPDVNTNPRPQKVHGLQNADQAQTGQAASVSA